MKDQINIKLLMVDDEEKFLESVAKRLELKGMQVVAVTDGEKAVEAAEKELFDVALVDFQMPGMDGAQVLKILKQKHKFLEIIMLTGHATVDSAVECTKLGAFKYLEKPYEFDKLIEVIKEAYEHRLKRKFENNEKRMEEIQKLSLGQSPLGLLRALSQLDDTEK